MKKQELKGGYLISPRRKQALIALGMGAFLCFASPFSIHGEILSKDVQSLQQQTVRIKGTVVDRNGEPIVGATILVDGNSSNGTVTDIDGNFALTVSPQATLSVSYIGYTTVKVKADSKKELKIVLEEDSKALEEVVVVGYGTVRKADLAGSVSVMDSKTFRDQPVTQVSQTLQGRVSGVQVDHSGAPGGQVKIRVRGSASISRSNDPLYVVDGIVRENGLTGINPDDIQSMQVLKDASSTAIYGSRGSNGVILITTKTGHANQRVISFDASIGIADVYKKYDVLTPYEYATAYREIKDANAFSDAEMTGYKNGTMGINWQDEIFRTGYTQNYKVAISNGNDKTQYYLSANHVNQSGIINNSSDKRYQLRANLTSDVTSWLHLTADFNLSHNVTRGSDFGASKGNVIWVALNYSPTMEMMDQKGNYNKDPYNHIAFNPKGVLDLQSGESMSNIANAMIDLRFKLLPGLTFTTTNGVDYYDGKSYHFSTKRVFLTNPNGAGNHDRYRMMLQTSNNLTYIGNWDKHSLTATAVWEASQAEYRNIDATSQNLPIESVGWWNLGLGANQYANNSYSKWALLSGVGRVMYNYDNRYLFTGTLRADGSSKFSKDKWGYFPSVAVAWNIGNEAFMKKQQIVQNAKLRISYGIVGSQAIEPYSTLGLMSVAGSLFGGTSNYAGYWSKDLATRNVTWEKTKQFDFGLDFSILDNRLELSVDYFNRKTTDALLQKSIPGYNGGGQYWVNSGEIRNSGVDFSMTGRILDRYDLSWTSTLNMTYLKNEVLSLAGDKFLPGTTPASGMVTEVNRIIPGESIGAFYGYEWIGLDDKGNNIYADHKKDGKIDSEDRVILGKSIPDVTFGWNNQLTWKNWDLNCFVGGSFGAKKLNLVRFTMASMVGDSKFITLRDAYNKGFDKVGTGAEYPSLQSTSNTTRGESSQWLEKADYIRLENVTLGYRLSKSITKFADLKLYVSAQNLFTITGYKGMDPASHSFSSANVDINNGVDLGAYPTPRTITFGVKMNF
ncbi:TonB-dependent receptor P3 [Bacteroides pyogenes]|nr:TonB-dependent receptor [Bacteroides pyogenes]MBR8725926.1 TonB-dependent receptor P3 [Bacteroides pyogenes]MBR8739206.1 TonB-dependent receptor P3 [Bacteroides pyogenes]MBR8755113.1 TonB-dependent receptor P3 [Bacteroides pyogenes]MBR8796395.1 TonB-dependent receptor P3 [Bacteroides pyogenes]MBR8809920.1 TonB-dependent receptor P3 [Bacteroides pyogenes]